MIGHLLHQVVVVRPFLGSGAFGATYGDETELPARVEYERKLVRDQDATEVLAECQVFLEPGAVVPPGSDITLPDDEQPRTVITSSRVVNDAGVDHHVVVTTS